MVLVTGFARQRLSLDVDNSAVSNPCPQPYKPIEKCVFSPTLGQWIRVPT